MSFNINDRVRVKDNSAYNAFMGMQGVVALKFQETGGLIVTLENGQQKGFWPDELELVDVEREALIRLAETLDSARLQANAIEETADQRGVYGTIALALGYTLNHIVGGGLEATRYALSDRVYDSILDGNSVREALKAVDRNNADQ